ncbi:MAG TPA: arginine--tRNA ligase [Bacteroidia bacterium]
MNTLEQEIRSEVASYLSEILGQAIQESQVLLNPIPADFEGDVSVVLFPFVKASGKRPDELGELIGRRILEKLTNVQAFAVVKGFLNLTFKPSYWNQVLNNIANEGAQYGYTPKSENASSVLIEYPSPNTNKPLHLGHLRNIYLGHSLSRILDAQGKNVIPVCLFNDRGTNISKSMVAWKRFANGATPESTNTKGDHFVGDYYVQFANALKAEIKMAMERGLTEEEAKKQSLLNQEVDDMTVAWENGDPEVQALWKMMNGWVYKGFDESFARLGISFQKKYYESDVYNLGKETVEEGLKKGIFYKHEDGSIRIDLSDVGLDEKVLLRSNGTSIYITQDIAIAYEKAKDFNYDSSIYVVGNEQDYHFKVLFEILKRLGMKASDKLYHLSYGMVELPTGKMKSREGTVVDADVLMDEMEKVARETAEEQGKLDGMTNEEKEALYKMVGNAALRYFILRVDPKKKMIFNPAESIDFQGQTGPFVQYTHARIASILRQAGNWTTVADYTPNAKEVQVIATLSRFKQVISVAGEKMEPSHLAAYVFELAKDFNQFYHECPVLKEADEATKNFRLQLCASTAQVLKTGMYLLGIEVPERM